MPSKFNSTAKKPGKAVKKPYRRGGVARYQLGGSLQADPRLEQRMQQRLDPRLMQQQAARPPTVTASQDRLGSNSAFAGRQGQQLAPPPAMRQRPARYEQRTAAQIDASQMRPDLQAERQRLGLPNPPPTDPQFLARMVANQRNPVLTPFGFAQQEQQLGNPNFSVTGRTNPQQPMNSPQALTGMLAPSQIPTRQRGFAPFQFPHQQTAAAPQQQVPQQPAFGRGTTQRQSAPSPWFPSTQSPNFLENPLVPFRRGGYVTLKTGGRVPRKNGVKLI